MIALAVLGAMVAIAYTLLGLWALAVHLHRKTAPRRAARRIRESWKGHRSAEQTTTTGTGELNPDWPPAVPPQPDTGDHRAKRLTAWEQDEWESAVAAWDLPARTPDHERQQP